MKKLKLKNANVWKHCYWWAYEAPSDIASETPVRLDY